MGGYLAGIHEIHGTEIWCDSPTPADLNQMIGLGAVGATSNPVLIPRTVLADADRWKAELPALRAQGGLANWNLYRKVAAEAAAILRPIYDRTNGGQGFLSVQVDPRNWNDPAAMVEQALEAAAIGPNISIKIPAVKSGLVAAEELAALGIHTTVTVSYSLPQVVQIAEAFRRGKARAAAAGKLPKDGKPLHNWAVLMIGRLDDHLRDVTKEQGVQIDPQVITHAGNAVAKKAYRLFAERGYESVFCIAAMRGIYHIDQYIGAKLVITVPPASELEFAKAVNGQVPPAKMDEAVPAAIIDELSEKFVDFRRAYDENGMAAEEFAEFGPSAKTLKQFIGGWESLIEFVG